MQGGSFHGGTQRRSFLRRPFARAEDTGLAKDSVVLLEQIRTLDKHRLRERAGQITAEDQRRVDQALDVSLGLSSY